MEQTSDSPTSVAPPLDYASPTTGSPPRGFFTDPVGWPLVIFTTLITALSLYAGSGPVAYLFSWFVAALGWMVVMPCWGIKAIIAVASTARQKPHAQNSWWKVVAIPFLFLATVVLTAEDVPSKIGFRIARPSMEQIARAQLLAPDGARLTRYVNMYGPCEFSHDGNAVTVWVQGAGFLDSEGYCYCPTGRPSASGWTTPIGGAWYKWHMKF